MTRMEPKVSKSKIQLQQSEYFDGCTTAAEVELRFNELIHFMEEQPLTVKMKKQLMKTAQSAIPRLMRTYRTIPSIVALLACASLLVVSCCDYRPANCIQFLQETLQPLSNPRVDKTLQIKLARLVVRSRLLVNHYSRDILVLHLQCMVRCSKHYREVRDSLQEVVAATLQSKQSDATECLLSLLAISDKEEFAEIARSILTSEQLKERIDTQLMKCLEKKLWIPCVSEIINMSMHGNFISQLIKEPYSQYLLGLLQPLVSKPELSYFFKFQSFYSSMIKDPELTQYVLLATTNVLGLRWKTQQTSISEANERAVFSLQTICEEIERRLIETVNANNPFLLKLEASILAEPHHFSTRFYKELFGVSKARNKLMQMIGIILGRVYRDQREVWETSYPFIELYLEALDNFDGTASDFKFLLFELNYNSFMKITSHLFIEFFKESLTTNFEPKLRLMGRFFGDEFYLWRRLLEKSVCPPNTVNWLTSTSVVKSYLPNWLEGKMQETFDFLKFQMDRRNVKTITAFWGLVSRADIPAEVSRKIVPYLVTNFDAIVNLFSEKQTAFNKIVYQQGIQWTEYHYKIYAEQRELEKKMSRTLIQSIVTLLARTNGLHRYLPENYCPETLSQRLLQYISENPNSKSDLYCPVLRIIGRFEHVSSMHLFARQVYLPLKKLELQRHIDLTSHASCLKELVFFKCDYPEMTLEWSWRMLCECALMFIRLNPKDFSLERDVLRAKILAFQACELILPNIKDVLLLKELFEHTSRVFEMSSKCVQMDELSVLTELRCEAVKTAAQLAQYLLKSKRQYVEYTHLMQTAIIDQSQELRLVVLKLSMEEKIRQPVFLMVLCSADPSQAIKQMASVFLETWFTMAQPKQIANIFIQLMFFLKNSSGIGRREQFSAILCGYLNEKSVGYAIEAVDMLKEAKIACCGQLASHRTIHGRKSQPNECPSNEVKQTQVTAPITDGTQSVDQQLKKRAKALKVKTVKVRCLMLTEHPLLDSI